MFLPLGLFLKLKKFPYITVLIILICVVLHIFGGGNQKSSELIEIQMNSEEYIEAKNLIFKEYCYSKGFHQNLCSHFDKNKEKKSKLLKNKNEVKSDGKEVTDPFGVIYNVLTMANRVVVLTQKLQDLLLSRIDNSSILKGTPSFNFFKQIHNNIFDLKVKLNRENDLLAKGNINLTSIFIAMFTHGDYFHLFSNMIALLVFGIYVEARVGASVYLLSYLISGFVSLGGFTYFTNPFINVVGASGNIFAVMGMFYYFFRDKRMKFWIFYFVSKIVSIPIKRNFFFLFILLELVLMITGGTNVAHGAHILGLAFGIGVAFIWEKKNNFPRCFLYKDEYDWWGRLPQGEPIKDRIEYSSKALKYNPFNSIVRKKILNDILEESYVKKELLKDNQAFCEDQLSIYMKNSFESNKENTIKILKNISMILHYTKILKILTAEEIIELLNCSIELKEYFVSLKLINYICENYPNLNQLNKFIRTGESIMLNIDISQEKINYLFTNSRSQFFSSFIENHIQFEEA